MFEDIFLSGHTTLNHSNFNHHVPMKHLDILRNSQSNKINIFKISIKKTIV